MATNTMPTRTVCAHSHLLLTLCRGNLEKLMKVNEKETAQRFIKDKYMLFISTKGTLLQRYLSAYNNDVASNEVATLRSVQSRIACYVL